jgi:hypothetical protein
VFPVSEAYRAAVRDSHRATFRAEIWRGGQKLVDVEPVSGQVTDDVRRAIRRTVSAELIADREVVTVTAVFPTYAEITTVAGSYGALEVVEDSYATLGAATSVESESSPDPLVPGLGAADPLNPYGNELRVWRGVQVESILPYSYAALSDVAATYAALALESPTYGGLEREGTVIAVDEEVPLGVFLLTEFDAVDNGTEIRLSVQGEDRARRISRNRWTGPYRIASGTTAVSAIRGILEDRWDDVEVVTATSSTATVGAAVLGQETDNDPWADARRIAQAAGLDVYFDADGRAVIADVESVEGATADFEFTVGADGLLLALRRSVNANTTYNGVIVTGEGTSADPVRAEAWDEDPTSPTYRYGPFGQVPRFYSSSLITSAASAQATAESILRKATGLAEGIEWSTIVDPAVQAGDVAKVVDEAARVNRVMVIDAVTVPFDVSGSMSAVGRTVSEEVAA